MYFLFLLFNSELVLCDGPKFHTGRIFSKLAYQSIYKYMYVHSVFPSGIFRTSEDHKSNRRANTLHDRNGMTHRGRITDSLSVRPMVIPADFSRFPPFWTIWTISFLPTPFSIPSHFPFETF